MHPRIPRVAAGLAAALTAVALTAAPVAAAPATPTTSPPVPTGSADLALTVTGEKVVRNAAIKQFFVQLENNGPDTAQGIRVTIDAGKLDPSVLSFGLPPGEHCESDGPTKVTCLLGSLGKGETLSDFPALYATTAKRKGSAGSFTVTVEAATPDPVAENNTRTVNVEAAPAGFDLTAVAWDVYADYAGTTPVAPGGTGDLHWALYNSGSRAVKGITFEIALPPYVTFADQRPGCKYNEDNNVASCRRTARVVQPGQVFQMVRPMSVKVAADAPGPVALTGGWVVGYGAGEASPEDRSLAARSTQTEDTEVEQADAKVRDEADTSDNGAPFSVIAGNNPVDLSVTSAPATGVVGEVVSVGFTATNKGPANSGPHFAVKAPAGTTALVPASDTLPSCEEAPGGLVCSLEGELRVGQTAEFSLSFRIDSASVGDDGTITVSNLYDSPEATPEDNIAVITITATGPGGGPGGGGGGLPVTGVQASLLGGVGLLVVVVGGVLLVLSRRRRVVLVAPNDEKTNA